MADKNSKKSVIKNPKKELSAGGLSNGKKKEWAKQLFTRNDLTQKEIALKVGVAEKTISQWVNKEKWDTERKTLLTTKRDQLNRLYDILDKMTKEGQVALEDDDPTTNPNTDGIIKITNAIKKLQSDTGLGEMIDTLEALISFVQKEDFEASQLINKWGDLFIKDRIATLEI